MWLNLMALLIGAIFKEACKKNSNVVRQLAELLQAEHHLILPIVLRTIISQKMPYN
jgi:hypothetical protein